MSSLRLIVTIGIIGLLSSVSTAQSLCAHKPGTQLRRSPSATAPVTWRVPKYMPLMATGKRQAGAWLEVRDLDGQTHWVPRNRVTSNLSCIVVKAKATRLRMGPGKQFQPSPIGLAEKYAAFLDLGGEDGWTQIENDDGEKGWVNMDHIWRPLMRTRMTFDR